MTLFSCALTALAIVCTAPALAAPQPPKAVVMKCHMDEHGWVCEPVEEERTK